MRIHHDKAHDEVARWVASSRARQGLGPTVTDPSVMAVVAELVRPILERGRDQAHEVPEAA
jgi:hypothetical protein